MQAYIKNFGVKNFRIFKENTFLELAPITALVGPNGSGKSTMMTAFSLVRDYFPADLAKLFHDKIGDKKLVDKIGQIKTIFPQGSTHSSFSLSLTIAPSSISEPLTAEIKLSVESNAKGLAKVNAIEFSNGEGELVIGVSADGSSEYGRASVDFTLVHRYYKEEFLRAVEVLEKRDEPPIEKGIVYWGHPKNDKSYFGVVMNPWIPSLYSSWTSKDLLNWDPKEAGLCLNFSVLKEFADQINGEGLSIFQKDGFAALGDATICLILSRLSMQLKLGEHKVFESLWSSSNYINLGRLSVLDSLNKFFELDRLRWTDDYGQYINQDLEYLTQPTGLDFKNPFHISIVDGDKVLSMKFELIRKMVEGKCFKMGFYLEEGISILALILLYRLEFDLYCERERLLHDQALSLFHLESLALGSDQNEKTIIGFIEAYLKALGEEIGKFKNLNFDLSAIQKAELRRRTSLHEENSLTVAGIEEYINADKDKWKKEHLNDFLSVGLHLFGFGNKISIERSNGEFEVLIHRNDRTIVNLVDCGFGIRRVVELMIQLMPVGLKRSVIDSNTGEDSHWLMPYVIHLEEPEANLHPDFQSNLADLVVYVAKNFHAQFIIETHSEYLIRELQILTARKEINPEDTVIYYFYPPDHPDVVSGREPQVKKINIQQDGRLSTPFGTGFYDKSARQMIYLMNLSNSN